MMNRNPKKLKEHNITHRLRALVFVVIFIVIIIVNIISRDTTFSDQENRTMTQRPRLTFQNLANGTYMERAESYLSDQFAGRNGWRRFYIRLASFGGSREQNGVFRGRHKQLMEDITVPSDAYLDSLSESINQFSDSHLLVKTSVLLVPDAAQILNKSLPLCAPVADQNKLFISMQAALSEDIHWIDGAAIFAEHADQKLYYKTDHHWTTQGAYLMFLGCTEALGIDDTITYQTYPVSKEFNGTLASTSGFCLNQVENLDVLLSKDTPTYVVNYVEENEKSTSLYKTAALDTKDKYAVFFGGNHSLIDIQTAVKNEKVLLVVKDSFANSFIPFLLPYYKEIVIVDPRYYSDSVNSVFDQYQITDTLFLYSGNTIFGDKNIVSFLNE